MKTRGLVGHSLSCITLKGKRKFETILNVIVFVRNIRIRITLLALQIGFGPLRP
jgi:hypothetical protein